MKLGFTQFLRSRLGVGLAEAKEMTDCVLEGQTVNIVIPDFSSGDVQQLEEIGVIFEASDGGQ